jgi:soluble lytic murein transglycosylase
VAGVVALSQPATAAPFSNGPSSGQQTQAGAKPANIKSTNDKTNNASKSTSEAKSKSAAKSPTKSQSSAAKPAFKPTLAIKDVPLPRPRPATPAMRSVALASPTVMPPVATVPAVSGPAAQATDAPSAPVFSSPFRPFTQLFSGSDKSDAPATTASSSLGQASAMPPAASTIVTAAALDVAQLKRGIELVRNSKQSEASEAKKLISDPVAKKLLEWVILRSDDAGSDFSRYVAFISANSNWPSIVTLRRKAEATAFQDRPDAASVEAYFRQWPPLSAKGKFAYARALLSRGDRKNAEALIRDAWRNDGFSQDVETKVSESFGDVLTRADHKARMDRRLYEKDDTDAGLRAAQRLGGNEVLIAKARIAQLGKGNAKPALDAVPAAARDDIGYKFARIQLDRRADRLTDAVALIKTIPKPLNQSHDLDEWWMERRVLARKLLDAGDAQNAYLVARDATEPDSPNYRAEHHFMAGWIALRYLHDPQTAYSHFLKITENNENPISLARGAYWSGRAAEALGHMQDARRHYQEAARYPTAYYGQIARAKAGLGELTLNPYPSLSSSERTKVMQSDIVRAAELLYTVDARDLAWAVMADSGDKSNDLGTLVLLSELTAKYRDARGMLLIGKLALARGVPLDHAAYPTLGVPDYKPIGPPVEPAIVYSICRQESWFNPKTVSSASAYGLMQVTPSAGKYIAGKFGATYDQKRLLSDQLYNVQFGAAELGDLIKDYRGSYIMTFAGYNAGRGRVKEWVAKYGDPRDPKIDPIDWVERIPFSETRNYVQRVMENMQVYRVRFGGSGRLAIEADLKRGGAEN